VVENVAPGCYGNLGGDPGRSSFGTSRQALEIRGAKLDCRAKRHQLAACQSTADTVITILVKGLIQRDAGGASRGRTFRTTVADERGLDLPRDAHDARRQHLCSNV
jgi:hypothetical protein